ESKTYGKVTVGQTSASNDSITELTLAKTITVEKPIQIFTPNGGFGLRLSNGALASSGAASSATWGGLSRINAPGAGDRFSLVRYDTPEIAGFTASASYGEDDLWAVALRYAGELHGFKLAAGIGYAEITDGEQGFANANAGRGHGNELGLSVSALHVDS